MKSLQEHLNESLNEAVKPNMGVINDAIDLIKDLVKKSKAKEVDRVEGNCVYYEFTEGLFNDINIALSRKYKKATPDVHFDESHPDYFTLDFTCGAYIEVSEYTPIDAPHDAPQLRIGFYRRNRGDVNAKQLRVDMFDRFIK